MGAFSPLVVGSELNTLEELRAWVQDVQHPVIIATPSSFSEEWSLEIYDEYRE